MGGSKVIVCLPDRHPKRSRNRRFLFITRLNGSGYLTFETSSTSSLLKICTITPQKRRRSYLSRLHTGPLTTTISFVPPQPRLFRRNKISSSISKTVLSVLCPIDLQRQSRVGNLNTSDDPQITHAAINLHNIPRV